MHTPCGVCHFCPDCGSKERLATTNLSNLAMSCLPPLHQSALCPESASLSFSLRFGTHFGFRAGIRWVYVLFFFFFFYCGVGKLPEAVGPVSHLPLSGTELWQPSATASFCAWPPEAKNNRHHGLTPQSQGPCSLCPCDISMVISVKPLP